MYSLLIAEDEGWMRELLVGASYWEQCGITQIWGAKNGQEALEILESEKIDFLLSDIRMPVMDGLELLAKVKEVSPETEVVMLSGFDEFNYVRTAMRLGAYDYLLKPIRDEELMQLFYKMTHAKSQKQLEMYRTVMEQSKWKQGRSLLQEQFLASWFSGRITTPTLIREKCVEMEIIWEAKTYVVYLMELDQLYVLMERYNERDMELLKYGIRNIVDEHLVDSGQDFYLFAIDQRLVVWAGGHQTESEMEDLLCSIRQNIKKYMKVTVSIGISSKHSSLDDAFKAYLEAVNSLKMKMYMGKDQSFFFESIQFQEDRQLFHRELQQRLHYSVIMGSIEEMQSVLEGVFDEIRRKQIPEQHVDQIVWLMTQIIWEKKQNAQAELVDKAAQDDFLNRLRTLDTIDEIQAVLTAEFIQTIQDTVEKRSHKRSKLISDILLYIDKHYSDELTLQALSEQFYMNPSYLSRLFKEEIGQIFTKYLMQLRVDKAKELLKTTHMKVYEISEAVGYTDVKYFNKIFKNITNFTPADYRSL
ncbi:response regulator [Paenibacillus alginolyticus]|uniref:Response regulator n=1 Tax=Paenibacillus alginolyticus TaxID=59839 RepID=A0ABT4GGH0_9BACL|nr:response regulator [Paenibacillus alginolyticus]MCY9695290.1 response regulator [Paenibacillus alginolyticus]MEC0144818.1 response regulator [Paenibacillus alginolyticus]